MKKLSFFFAVLWSSHAFGQSTYPTVYPDAVSSAGSITPWTSDVDADGYDFILDTDGDTAIVNDRDAGVADDEFDLKINNAVDFTFSANLFQALAGSVIEAPLFQANAASKLNLSVDSYALLTDAAGTAFTGLRFGGTSNSFPMIKRNGTALEIKRADDSAYSTLTLGGVTTSTLTVNGGNVLFQIDDYYIAIGGSTDFLVEWDTAQTNDHLVMGVKGSNRIVLVTQTDKNVNLGLANATNPELVIGSDNVNADQAELLKLRHDQTDSVFESDQGDFKFIDDGNKGVATFLRTKTESVTFASAPGDGSKVTTGSIIPDGAFVVGVSGRVTTGNTGGCTSMDVGIAALDTDAFGDGIAVTQNTTFTHKDGNSGMDWSAPVGGLDIIPNNQGAKEITVTAVGGDSACDDMVVALTVHYIEVSAATSN